MKRTIEYSALHYRRTIRRTTAPGNANQAFAERCPGCGTRFEVIPAATITLNPAPDPGIPEEQIIPRKRNKGDKL